MPKPVETGDAAAFGRGGIDGSVIVRPATRMDYVIGRAGDRALVPAIIQVEAQRSVSTDRRVQARRRLPRAVAHATYILAARSGRGERQLDPVDGHRMSLGCDT